MVMAPLGLWYLAAQLEALGHETDFRALDVDPEPEDGEFDQVWLSATSPQMYEVRRLAYEWQRWWKTRTVFGGAAPWARPESGRGLGFDLVVAGEADHPNTVASLVEMAANGAYTLYRPPITPGVLDWALPPVRRWDERYHFTLTGRDGTQHRTTTAFTSRGCPMACAFCESGRNGVIWDRAVRYEPVALVEAQLREIAERGHTGLMLYDDIFPLNKPRTLALLEILPRYVHVWRCFVRTDVIMKQGGFEYLRAMAESGLVEVLAGVESADNRIKANIHKGTTIEQDTQVLAWCKQLGIKFKASFILGLPGEDRESLERTREWILTQRPDRADVNALIPFPGTPITRSHDVDGNPYDVEWTDEYSEERFYKGAKRSAEVVVRTAALSSAEIAAFRDTLIAEIDAAGIPY
jgi:radical SAM superfamily enzyme YgiQ (UPF0313 family)